MALIDKASLLMVPSTYEAGKLYNVLPSGNRAPDNKGGAGYDQTRADFDFDRGSNAAATRINSSGLIEKYRENLLLQSNQFENAAWGKSSATFSGDTLTAGAGTAFKGISQNEATQGVQNISFDVAYIDHQWVQILFGTSGSDVGYANFDIQNKVIGNYAGMIDVKIQDFSTYVRISVAINASAKTSVYLIFVDSGTRSRAASSSSTGSFKLFRSQVETGLVATEYLNSTSVTAKAGVLIDLPRINYDANGENGALLLEPSRANIITNSEYLGGSDWIKSGNGASSVPVITSNAAISPEGVQNATRVDLDLNGGTSSGDWSWVYQNFTSTGNDETFSMYIKAVDASNVGKVIAFGAVSFTAQSLTADWVRIESTSSAAVGGYGNGFRLRGTEGTSDTASFYVFGIQHEQNATYPTSYIPTMGTAQTRAADSCSVTGVGDILNDSEGTLFVEMSALANDQTSRRLSISDGTNNNRVMIGYSTGSNAVQFVLSDGGAVVVNSAHTLSDIKETAKIAFKYKLNDCEMYINGARVILDTTATMPSGLDVLGFYQGTTNENLFANVKQLAVFNEALSDSELATLTTL